MVALGALAADGHVAAQAEEAQRLRAVHQALGRALGAGRRRRRRTGRGAQRLHLNQRGSKFTVNHSPE